MGSKKCKKYLNAHRGSYVKKKQPHNGGEKPKSGSAVGGCRIVNLDQLQKFSTHSYSFQNGTISLTGERYREALASVLSATCSGCHMEVAFPTSSKVTGLGGVNGGSATWQLSGGRCQPVEAMRHSRRQLMSMLGVLVVTKKSFMATEKALGRSWRESLEESMKEAAEKEKRNAIRRGSFREGVPAIMGGGANAHTNIHTCMMQSLAPPLS